MMATPAPIEERSTPRAASGLGPVRATFSAAVYTIVPEAAELGPAAWDELETIVERSIADRPPALRRRIRLFLAIVRWLPVLRYGRTFEALDPDRRARVLGRLQDHPLRLVRVGFWGLRALALMGYYGRAAAADAIGYRPHPRGWQALGR